MAESVKSAAKTRPYCWHCGTFVSFSTAYRHKQQFYNKEQKVWTIKRKLGNDMTGYVGKSISMKTVAFVYMYDVPFSLYTDQNKFIPTL